MQFNCCRHILIAVPLMIPMFVDFDEKSATIPILKNAKTDWKIQVKTVAMKIELRCKRESVSSDMFS